MPILYFLLYHFMLLIAGAFFILGFFLISRGEYKKHVDGTITREGKIFKWWWFFWHREKGEPIKRYYSGKELRLVFEEWNGVCGSFPVKEINEKTIVIDDMIPDMVVYKYEKQKGIKINQVADVSRPEKNWSILSFYKEEKDYVFPQWVRTWLSDCLLCHSSWLGGWFFLVTTILMDKDFVTEMYSWSSHPGLAIWFHVCFYCISLVGLLKILWVKTNVT